ncbi:MAG TPA: RES family NAD+ phosphorylase [Ignavibacteria bacterium]|nr:RES family NAD+ phosphorylase [Ignavibacteria bacterium]
MELFRISSEKYSKGLVSSGRPNRWNKNGEHVIYTGGSRSLSTLELIVHRNFIKPDIIYKVLIISVPDSENIIKTVKTKDLPDNWRKLEAYSKLQEIGSDWIQSKETLLLKVPSAVIPQEQNYIINIEHSDFKRKVKLVRSEEYFWDEGLLQ